MLGHSFNLITLRKDLKQYKCSVNDSIGCLRCSLIVVTYDPEYIPCVSF